MEQVTARRRSINCAINPDAGITLNAADALADSNRQHFTRAQVAYLIALAYQSGRAHAAAEDMAETVACWLEFAQPAATREQRVAARHAEMQAGIDREAARPKPNTNRLDCDWPPVTQPGVTRLRVVA